MIKVLKMLALGLCFLGALHATPAQNPAQNHATNPATPAQTLAQTPAPAQKSQITIAVENEEERLNPIFSEDHESTLALIFSGLARQGADGSPQPDLAESWEVSADGLEYTFALRRNATWHDGAAFSAADVKFTLDAIANPRFNSPLRPNFSAVAAVEVVGDYALKITLAHPYPALLDALCVGILPAHLLQGADLNTAAFNHAPIGTGAYRLTAYKKGQFKVLEAHAGFHLGAPATPRLVFRTVPDAATAALLLKSGEIDAALVGFAFAGGFARDARFVTHRLKSADYRALMFNFAHPFLREVAVRRALYHLLDREAMVAKLLHGNGFVAHHPLQTSPLAPAEFAKFEFDPARAHELLAAAGFAKNSRGIYERGGVELGFEIYAMSGDALRVAMAGWAASEFRAAGINARAIARPAGTFDYGAVDAFVVGWGTPQDADMHTFRVFGDFGAASDFNLNGYKDARATAALAAARSTLDARARRGHYGEFVAALGANPPYLFLAYIDYPLVMRAGIAGFKPRLLSHHGANFAADAWRWRWAR